MAGKQKVFNDKPMMKKLFTSLAIGAVVLTSTFVAPQPVSANFPDDGGAWADEVFSFLPKLDRTGQLIPAEYQNAWQALGPAEGDGTTVIPATAGVALGIRGQVTLKFTNTILNTRGNDLRIVAVNDGSPTRNSRRQLLPRPSIRVEASKDCWRWSTIAFITGTASVNLGSLSWAKCIQLTDRTNTRIATNQPYGFRIDGVQALHTSTNTPWLGQVHDTRWYAIDDNRENDSWQGRTIRPAGNSFCQSLWNQLIPFHNNWTENPTYNGVAFRDATYDTISRSSWDGKTMDQIHEQFSSFTCTSLTIRDPKMRNLVQQLTRINKGIDLWIVPAPVQ